MTLTRLITINMASVCLSNLELCPAKSACGGNAKWIDGGGNGSKNNDGNGGGVGVDPAGSSNSSTATVVKPVPASSFFEGVEKLLEVWFTKQNGDIEDCDLRKIPR